MTDNDILKTGEVVKILNVSPKIIHEWFRRGRLKGYRIPGTKHRRYYRSSVMRFADKNNMIEKASEAK